MRGLPACFFYSGDEAGRCHFAELDTRQAELAHVALGTTGDGATVVQTHARGVLGQELQSLVCLVVAGSLESGLLGGVFGHEFGALHLAGLIDSLAILVY